MRCDFKFQDSEGKILHVYKWIPNTQPIGIVMIAHGMTETALRYDEFANRLINKGFLVYGHDHRGHGLTANDVNELGYVADDNGFNWLVQDIYELITFAKNETPNMPIILFGHSMGSFVSQRFSQIYGDSIDGLILSGTNGTPTKLAPLGIALSKIEINLFGRKHISKLMNTLSFGSFNKNFKPYRTEYDWLCSVESEVDKYICDNHCGFICSSSFYYDLLRGLRAIHKKKNLNKIPKNLPIFIFAGDKDPVGNFGKGILNLFNIFKKYDIKNVQYKLYNNGRHEMLNEFNKTQVMDDIIEWIFKNVN